MQKLGLVLLLVALAITTCSSGGLRPATTGIGVHNMLRKIESLVTAALPMTLLLLAAAPAQAQTGMVAVGHGTYQS
jgi:hypothetical protein